MKRQVLIIGGGASGIMAAIVGAKSGAQVTIIERLDRIGKKILATGNGRCNLSNRDCSVSRYHSHGSMEVFKSVMSQFDVNKTLAFFEEIGIEINEKEDGKLYPRSDQASSVLNALRYELSRLNVDIICNQEVKKIETGPKFTVWTHDEKFTADAVIIATGGKSSPQLGSNGSGFSILKSLGYAIRTPFASLVQLKTDFPYLKQVAGTKVIGDVRLLNERNEILCREHGEILFADYGVSGPPILQISRQASYRNQKGQKTLLEIDLAYEYDFQSLEDKLSERFSKMPMKTLEESLNGFLNNRLIAPVIKSVGLSPSQNVGEIKKREIKALAAGLKNLKMQVTGTHQWNQSQVTAGGVDLDQINPNTLESKKHPRLYLCGEVLDIDGDCGGFNLQWAWSSGAIAGKNAANGGK